VTDTGGTANGGVNTSSQTFVVSVVAGGNAAPTLNPINPLTINEDSGAATVSLAGITDGGEGNQTITVTAVSSNTTIIPNPTVTYTSPATTGSISFTPVANAFGVATVSVTANDGQGVNNTTTQTFTSRCSTSTTRRPSTRSATSRPCWKTPAPTPCP